METLPDLPAARRGLLPKVAAILVVGAACAAAFWVGTYRSSRLNNSTLVIDDQSLDLGDVWEDDKYQCAVPITNVGDKDVVIADFFSSCTCLSIQPRRMSLAAHASAQLTLSLKLTTPSKDPGPKPVLIRLAPLLEGEPAALAGWTIRARVHKAISLDTNRINYGEVRYDCPMPTAQTRATCLTKIADLTPVFDSSKLTVQTIKGASDSTEYYIRVKLTNRVEPGDFESQVQLRPLLDGGRTLPAKSCTVYATIVDDIYAIPSAMVLGGRLLGHTATDTVVLTSRTGKPFLVESVQIPSDDLTVEPVKIAQDFRRVFHIWQKVRLPGTQLITVTFKCTREGKSILIRVPVSHTGWET
jgi:hypothetical protein